MKLPLQLCSNVGFMFGSAKELISAMGAPDSLEKNEITRLFEENLPPVTSVESLATMFGYNPGFVVSMLKSPKAHYRSFEIPKGRQVRTIEAPKVGLKLVQKWLSIAFQAKFQPIENVHGFVPGRSHLSAAASHLGADWVLSVDIRNFFPSVSRHRIFEALRHLGYQSDASLNIISRLCSMRGPLVQGSPCSPILSNIVLRELDTEIQNFAQQAGATYTRYADDIVISGTGTPPDNITADLVRIVTSDGWVVADQKTRLDKLPGRLKVHGLLVHGEKIRLTKGYRNRIRAFRHLLTTESADQRDIPKLLGHINYSDQVDRYSEDE